MKNLLVLIVLFYSLSYTCDLHAQSEPSEAEMKAFTEAFVTAYNNQDVEALQKMYLDDAVRVDKEGKETKGAAQIAALFKESFIKNNVKLTVKHERVGWSDYNYAFVAEGTYRVKGKTIVYDIDIDDQGNYSNVMIKDKADGQWKIAKTVLFLEE